MRLLALDIGSSSVKAAILSGDRAPRGVARCPFPTIYADDGVAPRAEVKLSVIERAIGAAIAALGPAARRVDLLAATTMSPSWLALDARGRPLTNVITHQDRRSVAEAAAIEARVGKPRHLALAGNRPFPGGISSTTWAWHLAHERTTISGAALVGHLGTWLVHALTGARVTDYSNAGFTGFMKADALCWSDTLIDAVGIERRQLPELVASDATIGVVTPGAARRFGLTAGTPMLAGCVDGSAAMLAAGGDRGVRAGQVVNVCGSTDVLAVCTRGPHPHEALLTRPLGVDGKWLSVGTIAAAGSAIEWAHATFFADLTQQKFFRRVDQVAEESLASRVRFDASLAGSRTAMDVRAGRLVGLTLSADRNDILRALLADLTTKAAARFDRFSEAGVRLGKDVLITGGGAALGGRLFRAGWPRGTRSRPMDEATLRGLWWLANR